MTDLEKNRITELKEVLDNLDEETLFNLHNEIEDGGDDEIFEMDMFNEMAEGYSPIDLAQRIFFGDFNPNHNYFRYNGYANFESTDFPSDWIYTSDLAHTIFNDYDSYGIDEIEELFDKWEEEDNEDEE